MKTVYSPQLDPDLVHELYLKAKAQQVPMTALTRHLLRDALELPQSSEPLPVRARRRESRKTCLSKRQVLELTDEVAKVAGKLDEFINAFGSLVQLWCRRAEGKRRP